MMKRLLTIIPILLMLTGCTPPRVHGDTVIQIPVSRREPTAPSETTAVAPSEAASSGLESIAPETAETEPPETQKPPKKPGRPPRPPKPPKPAKPTEKPTEKSTEASPSESQSTHPSESRPSIPPETGGSEPSGTAPAPDTSGTGSGAVAPTDSVAGTDPEYGTGPAETAPAESAGPLETAPTDPTDPTEFTFPDPYDLRNYAPWGYEAMITDACNAIRAEAGLPPLTEDPYLSAIASVRGYELTVSADGLRPDGRENFTALGDYGYPAERYLEYRGQVAGGEIEFLLSLWVEDPGFREMIENPDCTTLGIGFFDSDILTAAVLILV